MRFLSIIISWMPLLVFWAYLHLNTGHTPVFFHFFASLAGIIGLSGMLMIKRFHRDFFVCFFLFYLITLLLEAILIENVDIVHFMRSIALYGTFMIMILFPIKYYQGFILFYITACYFIKAFLSGEMFKEVLANSGNYISIFLILSLSLYYIGLNNTKRTITLIDIIPIIISLLITVWSNSRSGMIIFFFLFVTFLLVLIFNSKHRESKYIRFFYILLAMSSFFIIWYCFNEYEEIFNFSKFERKGFDGEDRVDMWLAYWYKMHDSIFYFLFGAPLGEIPIIRNVLNNPHNSFIQLHAQNGIVMFVVFFIFLFKSIVIYARHNIIYLLLIIAIMARGMTDVMIFGQYGMVVVLYLVLLPYKYKDKASVNLL